MLDAFIEVSESIRLHRNSGVVYLDYSLREDNRISSHDEAERFLNRCGLPYPEQCLEPISQFEAFRLWTRILHRDLVYGREIMPKCDAEKLASDFISLFHTQLAVCLTNNVDAIDNENGLWSKSDTEATINVGAIAMDDRVVGYIWVEDEC